MKTLIQLFLIFWLANTGISQSSLYFPEEMVVTASSLNVRETPDINGAKVTSLSRGTVVQFVEAFNGGEYVQIDTTLPYAPWLKIRYKDKTGWVFGAYVTGTYNLLFEDTYIEFLPSGLQWYGVYQRDSFADEIRKVNIRVEESYSEMYGTNIKTVKTDQRTPSKFLIGAVKPLKTGYAGPLGFMSIAEMYLGGTLQPGANIGIHPGQEISDTIYYPAYLLAATGCATLTPEDYVQVKDYRLILLDYNTQPAGRQDLTQWVKSEVPEGSPNVNLVWYGDLDGDHRADFVLSDCPYEVGCRSSLYLSSQAKRGEYTRKVCEYFFPGE